MDDMLFSSSGSEGMPEDYYLEREMTRTKFRTKFSAL
jgi:hypothetical protein